MINRWYLFPRVKFPPIGIGNLIDLTFNAAVSANQNWVTAVLDADETISSAVAFTISALQQVMGASVAFE